MGSKVASKGLGFIYAVTLGGYLGDYKPGDRANSHITPTLLSKKGKIVLALGAAGGSRIVPAVVQVASRYIDQNISLEKALMLPRVYPSGHVTLETSYTDQFEQHIMTFLQNFI